MPFPWLLLYSLPLMLAAGCRTQYSKPNRPSTSIVEEEYPLGEVVSVEKARQAANPQQHDSATRGDQDTSYLPHCSVNGLMDEDFELIYQKRSKTQGYMKLDRSVSKGFSCKEEATSADDKLPLCAVACSEQSSNIVDAWGWCEDVDGFDCRL